MFLNPDSAAARGDVTAECRSMLTTNWRVCYDGYETWLVQFELSSHVPWTAVEILQTECLITTDSMYRSSAASACNATSAKYCFVVTKQKFPRVVYLRKIASATCHMNKASVSSQGLSLRPNWSVLSAWNNYKLLDKNKQNIAFLHSPTLKANNSLFPITVSCEVQESDLSTRLHLHLRAAEALSCLLCLTFTLHWRHTLSNTQWLFWHQCLRDSKALSQPCEEEHSMEWELKVSWRNSRLHQSSTTDTV